MLDVRTYIFCQSLNRLQRGLSAIAELLVLTLFYGHLLVEVASSLVSGRVSIAFLID